MSQPAPLVFKLTPQQREEIKRRDRFEELLRAIEAEDVTAARALIPLCDPKARDSKPLWLAAVKGSSELVALLIPVSDPAARQCEALRSATCAGHAECARLLFPVSNINDKSKDFLILEAAHRGHADCVSFFLSLFDPCALKASPLIIAAARSGSMETLALILQLQLSSRDLLDALNEAARYNSLACARILLPLVPIDLYRQGGSYTPNPALTPAELARSEGHAELADELRAFELAQIEAQTLGRSISASPRKAKISL